MILGLIPKCVIAKGPTWHLVSNTDAGRRTFRIDRVSSVELTDDLAQRPEGFDLAESWREIADEVDRKHTPFEAQAVCAPDGIGLPRMVLGGRIEVGGSTPDGRIEIVIRGHNEYALAGELAGLIEWLEVAGPQGVRDHLASIGGALVAVRISRVGARSATSQAQKTRNAPETPPTPTPTRTTSRAAAQVGPRGVPPFVAPRGLSDVTAKLATYKGRYAATGSLAAKGSPIAPVRQAMLFVDDADRVSRAVDIRVSRAVDVREADEGANLLIAEPFDDVVYERTTIVEGLTIVAPSQAAADLLTGSGRMPSEGEELLDRMKGNERAWRR